ncbi:MAG: hypothetical protein JWM11_2101 [Planctomycetaceae bacterium]|nr:hypothetical protein [Planctomycetaceae bacterium]
MTQPHDSDDMPARESCSDQRDSASLTQSGFADELAASILEPTSDFTTGPSDPRFIGLSAVDHRRVADILWVNSLLTQAFKPQRELREARIERVMAALVSNDQAAPAEQPVLAGQSTTVDTKPHSRFRPQSRFRAAWMSALLVLFAVGLFFQATDQSRQARAAVAFMRRVAAQPTDREYLVTLSFTPPHDAATILPQQQVTGDLFVRGGEAFAFRTPALIGPGKIWMGGDAKGVWLKPARGPMVLQGSAEGLLQRYLRQPIETPFLQITTVLERLSDHYEIELLADEIPPGLEVTEPATCRHIRGTCRNPNRALPDIIDVWSARQGGNVLKLVMDWQRESRPGLLQVEFNFVRQAELPAEWYRPEGHARGSK